MDAKKERLIVIQEEIEKIDDEIQELTDLREELVVEINEINGNDRIDNLVNEPDDNQRTT